jgi:predicted phosphodiesterase
MGLFDKLSKKKKPVLFGVESYSNPQTEIAKIYKNYDNKLFKEYGKCKPFDKTIKILIFSDTHSKLAYDIDYDLKAINKYGYDVCLLLGDISCDDIRIILEHVDKNKVYGILGNHDYLDNLEKFNIPNINGQIININGVDILGIEGCIKYKSVQPGFTLEEGFKFIKQLPPCDILITHSAPFGAVGLESNSVHIGAPYINKYMFEKKCPIVISGHNHIDKKHKYLNGTLGLSVYKQRIIQFNKGSYENLF